MTDDPRDLPKSGRFEEREHRFPVRVYFEDTDVSGIVYHASYLRFMERARSDMLRGVGIDQRATMEAAGGAYAVVEIGIKYLRPAFLDDDLLICSTVAEIAAASCVIHQRVMRTTETLAEAKVKAALVSQTGRPLRQPREWVEIFERLKTGKD